MIGHLILPAGLMVIAFFAIAYGLAFGCVVMGYGVEVCGL